MPQTISAKEQELKRIFSNDYRFEIPPFQRPYAWTTEQTSELLDDLVNAMGDDSIDIDKVPPYFLGSIVLIKDPTQTPAKVVDGQQRLTTLTILLCVLRELSEDEGARSSRHKYVCEPGDKDAGTENHYRLSLRERDRNFFRDNVQTLGELRNFIGQDQADRSDSKKRIHENTKHLWDKLSDTDKKTRDRLMGFLLQRCYLVVVSASDQDSAYRVFSVINSRGLDLSPTDILKAEIIGATPNVDDIRDRYTKQWEDIEEDLGRDDFRELFSHIRMIYMKSKVRNLVQEFRRGVLSRANGELFINTVLDPFAEAYQIVSKSAYKSTEDAEKVNASLCHLNRLDNSDWVPPAIAFFKANKNDREVLIKFIRYLERLAYALLIRRANINERINRYASVLRVIEQENDLFAESSALQLSDEEKKEVLNTLDGPIYLQERVRLPLLLRLDTLLADSGATYEHKRLSIEHVLPQTPEDGSVWRTWFPDKEERESWTHKLANLVLLSRRKNSQAQNFDFVRKKETYFQPGNATPFALTTEVCNKSEWTPVVLEQRQQYLLGCLKEEWRLD